MTQQRKTLIGVIIALWLAVVGCCVYVMARDASRRNEHSRLVALARATALNATHPGGPPRAYAPPPPRTSSDPNRIMGVALLPDERTTATAAEFCVAKVGAQPQPTDWHQTDAGHFSTVPLQRGEYTVSVRIPGYQYRTGSRSIRIPRQDLRVVQVVLSPAAWVRAADGGTLCGTVVDHLGRGVSGARVSLRSVGASTVRHSSTAPDGRYSFQGVPAGMLTLVAVGQGHRISDPRTVTCRDMSSLVVPPLILPSGGTLRVYLQSPAGKITSGASVQALLPARVNPQIGTESGFAGASHPDKEGAYVLEGLEPGAWTLTVHAEHHQEAPKITAQVVAGKTQTVRVSLKPLRLLTLKITDPRGRPVANAAVTVSWTSVHPRGFNDYGQRPSRTDAGGVVRVADAPPSMDSLTVKCWEGYCQMKLPPGGGSTIPVRLGPMATIEGELVSQGVRLPRRGVAVALICGGNKPNLEPLEAGWDELGQRKPTSPDEMRLAFEPKSPRFRFEKVTPYPHTWWVHLAALDAVALPVQVQLKPGMTTHVKLIATRPAALKGRVSDAQGKPVRGAQVSVWYKALTYSSMASRSVVTDQNGSFEAENLFPGEVGVWAMGAQMTAPAQRIILEPGKGTYLKLALTQRPKVIQYHGQ